MAGVEIIKSDRVLEVTSPHHPDLAEHARELGGIWTGSSWTFDINYEDDVRELYMSMFYSEQSDTGLQK